MLESFDVRIFADFAVQFQYVCVWLLSWRCASSTVCNAVGWSPGVLLAGISVKVFWETFCCAERSAGTVVSECCRQCGAKCPNLPSSDVFSISCFCSIKTNKQTQKLTDPQHYSLIYSVSVCDPQDSRVALLVLETGFAIVQLFVECWSLLSLAKHWEWDRQHNVGRYP